jgi:hypothetical protein
METKFQTSFIPKKPLAPVGGASIGMGVRPSQHHGTSLFMTIAVIIFIISIAVAGGTYAWKALLLSSQENYKNELAERERLFNVDLIEELKRENVKIDIAKGLINRHLAVSQVFGILGRLTIESVRYVSMNLSSSDAEGVKITLDGHGTSLSSVAFQSDVLARLERYGLRKVVKNPILSDPALDQNGTVSFGFTASIDPSFLSYEQSVLSPSGAPEGEAVDPGATDLDVPNP